MHLLFFNEQRLLLCSGARGSAYSAVQQKKAYCSYQAACPYSNPESKMLFQNQTIDDYKPLFDKNGHTRICLTFSTGLKTWGNMLKKKRIV